MQELPNLSHRHTALKSSSSSSSSPFPLFFLEAIFFFAVRGYFVCFGTTHSTLKMLTFSFFFFFKAEDVLTDASYHYE